MRVLYYNWVDYLDDERRGGGVTIYQRNLMRGWAAGAGAVAGGAVAPGGIGVSGGGANGAGVGTGGAGVGEVEASGVGISGAEEGGAGHDVEAWFLSAGISHDLRGGRPRWQRVSHGPVENRARRFEIVNSGTLAFSHHSFGDPAQVHHPATVAVVAEFLDTHGPFDVVHFNNLEGLPAEVLALKARFPATRFVLTLHNYYPFCPQVNLWFQERAHCADFDGGRNCTVCLPHRHDPRLVRRAHALAFALKRAGVRPGTRLFDHAFRPTMRVAGRLVRMAGALRQGLTGCRVAGAAPGRGQVEVRREGAGGDRDEMPALTPTGTSTGAAAPLPAGPGTPPLRAAEFAARRRAFVALINAHCDRVLCVSDRVRAIAAAHGLDPALLRTDRIGTAHAARFAATAPRPSILRPDGTLGLVYLGYMRADKGFDFLLAALEALPGPQAGRLHLVVAAPSGTAAAVARLRALGGRLASLRHVDGYDHDGLDAILAEVDVGVVPVLWEDNLPQVAIEMHARRIPLLTSDRGGARELSGCDAMVFPAGSVAGFADRIAMLLEGRITAHTYWSGPVRAPVSMAAHLAALRAIYAEQAGRRAEEERSPDVT